MGTSLHILFILFADLGFFFEKLLHCCFIPFNFSLLVVLQHWQPASQTEEFGKPLLYAPGKGMKAIMKYMLSAFKSSGNVLCIWVKIPLVSHPLQPAPQDVRTKFQLLGSY